MQDGYGMPKLEAKVKKNLEKAYELLLDASNDMDCIHTVDAGKIATVRKLVLKLLNEDLRL